MQEIICLCPIQLDFSQPIDKESLEKGLSISPDFEYFLEYEKNDCCVRVIPKKQLETNQRYIVSLDSSVMDIHRNFLPKEVAKSFYYQKDLTPFGLSFKVLQRDIENGGTVQLAPNDWIDLEFTREVNLDQISSFIFLEPVEHSTIAPPLEIIRDYKSKQRLRRRPNWNSSEEKTWGKSWKLVAQSEIQDKTGISLDGEQEIVLSYTLREFRPPEFIGALMTNLEGQPDLQVVFSPEIPFSSMELPPENFPTALETLPTTVELNLFFKVSSEAAGMDDYSLMEHTSLTSSNDCCELTLKRLESSGSADTTRYNRFSTVLEDLGKNTRGDTNNEDSSKIVTVRFYLELLNRNQKGLVTLELAPELTDSLGNKLGKTNICQVNKL